MSRNGAGVYTLPDGYLAEPGDTILADQHNSPLEDLQTDANTPRPIVAGGTGASSATSARSNLSVMSVADIQSGYVPKVATKAALSALDTASFKAAVLTETTREKLWMWKSGDFSAEEAADTDNVNYIPADGVTTSLGCWVAATGDGVTIRTIAAGGTGADNAADARTNLGLEIGTDVQAHSAVLDATTASFTTAQETKLSGIETGADVTDATNVNAAGAVMNTDTATTDMQFVGTGSDLSIDPAKLLKRGDALANVPAATKADAEALTPDTAPDFIETAGYSSAGDGGGALYKKVAAEPSHEGKFSITLSDGVTVVWYELAEEVIRPQMFGAVADGVTDDKAAFSALAGAIAAGFKKARVRAGNYLCGYTSTAGDRFDVNGVDGWSLEGDGKEVTRIIQSGSAARPFTVRNCDGISIRGIHFDMTYVGGASNNLDIMNCNQATIEHNRFEGGTFYGLGAFEDTFDGIDGTLDDLTVRFNEFVDSGIFGFEHFPKVKSNGLECHNNIFRNCGADPIGIGGDPAAMKPGQATENARIYNNKIYGAAGAGGIWMGNYEDIECFGNEIYDVPDVAISISAAAHPYPYEGSYRSAIVRDNLLVATSGFVRSEASITVSADASAVTFMGPVVIERNTIINDSALQSVRVQTLAAIPTLEIVDNHWETNNSIFIPISLHNASGAAPSRPLVKGNLIVNRNLAATVCRVELVGSESPRIVGNRLVNMGRAAIQLTSCTGTVAVEDNVIDGYNVDNASSVAAINVTDSGTTTYNIRRNKVLTNQGHPKAIVAGNSASPTFVVDGNLADDVAVSQLLNTTPTVYVGAAKAFASYGKARMFYGSAAPTSGGVYVQGDIVWNTAPAASGNAGWICTSGGSPGTWKTFGTIAA